MMLEIEAAARLIWSPKLSGFSSISKMSLLILSKSQSAYMRAKHSYALLDILKVQESRIQILGRQQLLHDLAHCFVCIVRVHQRQKLVTICAVPLFVLRSINEQGVLFVYELEDGLRIVEYDDCGLPNFEREHRAVSVTQFLDPVMQVSGLSFLDLDGFGEDRT
jgi:hypothetical protein